MRQLLNAIAEIERRLCFKSELRLGVSQIIAVVVQSNQLMFHFNYINNIKTWTAAVSCVTSVYWLGGVGLGSWLTGKLGRAWVADSVDGGFSSFAK